MIHYLNSEELEDIQRFSKIFNLSNSNELTEVDMPTGVGGHQTGLSLFLSRYRSQKKSVNVTGVGCGIHIKKMKAAFGAMGEAVERYCFSLSKPDVLNRSYNELRRKNYPCLDPESYKIFADEQKVVRSGEVFNLTRLTRCDWIWFENPARGAEKILLPSQFNSYMKVGSPFYFAASTNGNACGRSAEEAKLAATFELLERDAVLFYWWTKNTPLKIDLSDPNPALQRILVPYSKILNKISLFYLKTDLLPPVVLSVYRGDRKNFEPYLAVSASCHLDPLVAAEKALRELIHCMRIFADSPQNECKTKYLLDFDKTIWDFHDHLELYGYNNIPEAYSFLFPKQPQLIAIKDIKALDKREAKKNLSLVLKDLAKNNHRIYFKNATTREIESAGLHVYRAFSPDILSLDALHRYRPLGFRRYYTLSKKLNLPRRPKTYFDLNPFPHPFP